jgi:F-type H+-transporting ATPase subunit delta
MAAVNFRYARALAAVVDEQKLDAAATQQQLHDFSTTLQSSHDLREVLENPSIPEAQKLGLLDALAAKTGMSKTVRNFVALLASHQRLNALGEIIAAYAAIADEESSVTEAEVVSANALDASSKQVLEAQIAKLANGNKVSATYSQDPTLLGGAIVRIGSTVYDGSIRGQLQQLKQRLLAVEPATAQ